MGTVISYQNTPDIFRFYFVASNTGLTAQLVKVGRFVGVREAGLVIAQVMNVVKINEYFLNANTLNAHGTSSPLTSIFPVDQWEYMLCEAEVMGQFPDADPVNDGMCPNCGKMEKSVVPVSPGSAVRCVEPTLLENFLGLNGTSGLNLGTMEVEQIPVKVDLTKLVHKHLAILAMSGAGKSYLVSVILEEILRSETPMPPVIIVDTHGEYAQLLSNSKIQEACPTARVEILDGSFLQIGTPQLTIGSFFTYMHDMSPVQGRELSRVFNELKAAKMRFDLKDLVAAIEADEKVPKKTKEALVGWLYELDRHGMFATTENPRLPEILKPNTVIVFNLAGLTSNTQKQIILDYFASRAFYLRKNNAIPPFVLVIEEAHQFIPQAAASNAIATHTIETIAREGRKFFASLCLISQRPVHLNTTILSQCNTQIILRVTNPNDLDHIRSTSEKITGDSLKMIASLPVGHALIVGTATNIPIFFTVREREFLTEAKEASLLDALDSYIKSG